MVFPGFDNLQSCPPAILTLALFSDRECVVVSDLLVLLEEFLEGLHVQAVVDIGVPVEGRLMDGSVPPASGGGVLLVAHVVVRESGELAALPAEVALVPTHVQAAEEE